MPRQPAPSAAPFTPRERDLIRREMSMHFGQYPSLANGIFLRPWNSEPLKGQAKVPVAVKSMLDRGLVEIAPGCAGFRAVFTETGLQALREMA